MTSVVRICRWRPPAVVLSTLLAIGCGGGSATPPPSNAPARQPAAVAPGGSRPPDAALPAASSSRPGIVILGDSLTAGLGLDKDDAYPALLQRKIDAAGLRFEVSNAGVSGDTSAGGLSRLEWALSGNPQVLVVALGGNDALRGLPVDALSRNLSAIIEQAQARGVRVVLAGMEAPPNFGQSYSTAFHNVYPALAARYHVPLVPFLLKDVAGSDVLNQSDGIHPTAEGARIVADNVWAVLEPLLKTP